MALVSAAEKELSGGEETLNLLRKRVEGFRNGNKQNVAVIGRKHTGKSSLLLKFFYEMRASGEAVPVYVELRKEPFQVLEKRFADALLYHFRERYGSAFEEVFPREHTDFSEKIGRIARSSRRSHEQALSAMFDLLAGLQRETGLPVVFILDEFQKLSLFRVKNPYSLLGEKIMTQKEVMYLVSSSTIRRARVILDDDLSLLFGNFEVHEPGSFSEGGSAAFAAGSIKGFRLGGDLLSFLLSITGSNPFYMESILCGLRREACLRGGVEIGEDALCSAVARQLHNPAAPLHQYFLGEVSEALDFRSSLDFELLLAVAEGLKSSSRIARAVSRSTSQTTRKLEKFVNADILLKFGQVYDYADPLLKLWFRTVYSRMCSSFKPVQDGFLREETKNHIKNIFSSFLFFHGMETGERLRRLFGLFENDVVELAGKAVKLPKFSSVASKTKSGRDISVYASAGRRTAWAAEYAEAPAGEEEILGFLGKLKGFPRAGVKIFICLDGIDTDAKLIAKEKGTWLWTVQELNVLCDVYEQPRIMLKEKSNG